MSNCFTAMNVQNKVTIGIYASNVVFSKVIGSDIRNIRQ